MKDKFDELVVKVRGQIEATGRSLCEGFEKSKYYRAALDRHKSGAAPMVVMELLKAAAYDE